VAAAAITGAAAGGGAAAVWAHGASASTAAHSASPSSSAYFHSSPKPARRSRGGQGRERRQVGQHRARLVERADQVLAGRQIDRGLAADRRVGHRDQRGRQVDDVDAAVQGRRDEAGEIADDAAAQREDRAGAIEPGGDQRRGQPAVLGQRLRRLAGRDRLDVEVGAGGGQRGGDRGDPRREVAVGHQRVAAGAHPRGERRGERAVVDDHRVAAVAEAHPRVARRGRLEPRDRRDGRGDHLGQRLIGGRDRGVGAAVGRRAAAIQRGDLVGRPGQERPRARRDPGQRDVERHVERDHRAGGAHPREVVAVGRSAAAGGHDRRVASRGQRRERGRLALPEGRLVGGHQRRHRLTGGGGDRVVEIDERPAQRRGDASADRGLAGGREADQEDRGDGHERLTAGSAAGPCW
jgi:hypothetical protein